MPKSLIITRHYLDENNGGSNASKGFIWSYAFLNPDTTLVYPEHEGFDSGVFIPKSVKKNPVYDLRTKIKKGLDVYRGCIHRFSAYVKHFLAREKFDLIFLDHSIVASGIIKAAKRSGAKVITIHHNVEADYIKDNLPSWFYRIPFVYFSKKAERDALCNSDVNLTLTDSDAKVFSSWYPSKNLHLHTIGVCEYRWFADDFLKKNPFNNTFVISGSLCFEQSVTPIVDFLAHYFPIMKKICPGCHLIVTGRNPGEIVKRACLAQDGVELVANPQDIQEVIKKASIYICPIYAGSGIKLRVLDGLKVGVPVVCHKVSAVGYETFKKAGCLFDYDNKVEFESAIASVVAKNYDANVIYSLYRKEFSLMAGVKRLQTIIKKENLL